jgi:hypothetical protein
VHAIVGMKRNEPHWLLTEQDAKVYGTALANAMRHLPIGATQKALDFTALAICAFNMETPRVYASMRNQQQRRAQAATPPPPGATVFQFRPPPANGAAPEPSGSGVEGFTGDGVDSPIGGHH